MKPLQTSMVITLISLGALLHPLTATATTLNRVQTNYVASIPWTWQSLAKTPNVKWRQAAPKAISNPAMYAVEGRLNKYSNIEVYGSKASPSVVIIRSSQSYKESEDGKDTYGLYDLFNKSELTPIKSNCNKNKDEVNTGEYQHFYQWYKAGSQPLYVFEGKIVSGTFSGGVIKEYAIVKNFNDFNLLADSATGSIFDKYVGQDNAIKCVLLTK